MASTEPKLEGTIITIIIVGLIAFTIGYAVSSLNRNNQYDGSLDYFESQLNVYGGEGVTFGSAGWKLQINENTTLGGLRDAYFYEKGHVLAQEAVKNEIRKVCEGKR